MRLDGFIWSKLRNASSGYYQVHGVRPAEISAASWMKSSWSNYNGNCVEVAHLKHGHVGVRDTKDLEQGPVLIFTRPEWDAFLMGAKSGEFDHD